MSEPRPTPRSQALAGAAVLVFAAFGGAGLAGAADRPHTADLRPELTVRADRLFAPWRTEMTSGLKTVAGELATLAQAGRDAIGGLYRGRAGEVESLLGAGEAASAATEQGRAGQLDLRLRQAREVQDLQLGSSNRAWLARVDDASDALEGVPEAWSGLALTARRGAGLLKAARAHEESLARATRAAREARWADALALLEQAASELQRMRDLRDGLASKTNVAALDELLRRYEAVRAAMTALHEALRDGAAPRSANVTALEEQVEQARAQLPDDAALTLIVADAAGPPLAEALVRIEQARGLVAEVIGVDSTGDAPATP